MKDRLLFFLQESFAVVFHLSCRRTLRQAQRGRRNSYAEDKFPLDLPHHNTLCVALVVIKNRPLPFWSKGPIAFWSILCSTLFPKGFLGRRALLSQQQLRVKGGFSPAGSTYFYLFFFNWLQKSSGSNVTLHNAMRKLLLDTARLPILGR